jgi:hypothetical protein
VTPSTSIVRSTWRALLLPRRLLPILVVSIPLLVAQAAWTRDGRALPLGVLLCLAFVALAPVSYRVLFPDGLEFSHGAVRLVLYSAVGAGVVLSIGVGVPKVLHIPTTLLTDRLSLAIDLALFLVGGWGLGRDIDSEQKVTRALAEVERARLLALRAHLDPHFLFNTLNAIAEWCRTDGEVAEAAVLKLSAMLRAVLSGVQASHWSLEQELSLARTLFELHRLRDAEAFEYREVLPTPLPSVQVPALTLLTLAENAVKHGPAKGHRGLMQLEVSVTGPTLTVTLENPGPWGGPRAGSHGLPTLERQLALTTDGRGTLTVGPAPTPERTRATLTLPLQQESNR